MSKHDKTLLPPLTYGEIVKNLPEALKLITKTPPEKLNVINSIVARLFGFTNAEQMFAQLEVPRAKRLFKDFHESEWVFCSGCEYPIEFEDEAVIEFVCKEGQLLDVRLVHAKGAGYCDATYGCLNNIGSELFQFDGEPAEFEHILVMDYFNNLPAALEVWERYRPLMTEKTERTFINHLIASMARFEKNLQSVTCNYSEFARDLVRRG